MSDQLHFEGDPATDSARRHLQRVLAPEQPRKNWLLALAAGGTAWGVWRVVRAMRASSPEPQGETARAGQGRGASSPSDVRAEGFDVS